MTSPTEPTTQRISERRAAGTRVEDTTRYHEPTVEFRVDPQVESPVDSGSGGQGRPQPTPAQPVGRWWSGQPDDDEDETLENEATWAKEPTVERAPDRREGLFRRRKPGR